MAKPCPFYTGTSCLIKEKWYLQGATSYMVGRVDKRKKKPLKSMQLQGPVKIELLKGAGLLICSAKSPSKKKTKNINIYAKSDI